MKIKFRSDCPLSSGLDIIGDRWSLLVIRDMLTYHKTTFKDFSSSFEGIATNILSTRLKQLVEYGIARKTKLPNNRKVNIYTLTEKGLQLTPLLMECAFWTVNNFKEENPQMYSHYYNHLNEAFTNKDQFYADTVQKYRTEVLLKYNTKLVRA